MAVSRKAMTEGLSKCGNSDPLSLVLAGDARDSMNYGMIATGNHQYSNSLRGAPPLVSKGSRGAPAPVYSSMVPEKTAIVILRHFSGITPLAPDLPGTYNEILYR